MSTATTATNGARALENGTVILEVIFHRPGIRRKGDVAEIETSADKAQLGLSKQIISSPEYKDAYRIASHCRDYLRDRELKGPFKTGRHLLPVSLLRECYEHVEQAEAEYSEAVERFLAVYPSQKEAARESLGLQYRESDYPSVDRLRAAFWIEKRITQWSTPDPSRIGEYLYEKERERVSVELTAMAEDAKLALREGIRELASRLARALGRKENGHRRQLRPETYQNVLEWLALFDKRDVLKDEALGAVVADIRGALDGNPITELRSNDGLRESVKGELEGAIEQLGTLLVDAPARSIVFDEDE